MSARVLATRHELDASATVQMINNLQYLRSKNVLSIAELELAAEAALLSLHTSFETFIRESYLECIAGNAGISGVRSKLRATTSDEAQIFIAGDRRFLEWLPIRKTLDRAFAHLRGGQPFVRVWGRDQVIRHLDLMHCVRNRVAHSSEEALRLYEKRVARGDAAFERPARWLLHATAVKSNIELIADATIAASRDLASDDRTPHHLGPAFAIDGQRAAPGTYRCTSCQRIQFVRAWGEVQPCPRCSNATQCAACGKVSRTQSTWRLEALKAVS